VPRSHAPSDLPPTPPPEALDAVAAAWERAQDLQHAGWELELTHPRWSRRLRGSLRDATGRERRRMTPCEIVAFACGELPPPA